MAAIVALLLTVAALVACMMPLLSESAVVNDDESRLAEDLASERDRVIAALRDADLDLAMGKISEADHQAMRRSLEARAVTLMAALEDGESSGGAAR